MKSTKLLLLTLIIVFSSPTIPASAETGFFDDFEYSDDIENHGYSISNQGDEHPMVDVRNIAAKDGNRGLYMGSFPIGAVLITHVINIVVAKNTLITLDVYGVGSTGYIRINIRGEEGWLSIDYGHGGNNWEGGSHIYNSDEVFPINDWHHMNRTLIDDIKAGLSRSDSPYTTFTPLYVESFDFIQDGDGSLLITNFFDNIFVSGKNYSFSHDQADITDEEKSTTENNHYPPPSDDFPVFLVIVYILGSLFLLFSTVYIIGWAKIRNSIKNIFTPQSGTNTIGNACGTYGELNEVRTLYCVNCGELNEDGAIFCINCGERFPEPTPVKDTDRSQP